MSATEKLNYLKETKNQIKEAIKGKGVSVLDTDPFRSYASKIGQIESGGTAAADDFYKLRTYNGKNLYGLFAYTPFGICTNTDFMNLVENLDVSKATRVANMFANSQFRELNLSKWRLENVTDLENMFRTSQIRKVDLTGWDTSNITNIHGIFYSASLLTEIIGTLDMINVTNALLEFDGCSKLVEVRIKNLNCTGLDLSDCTQISHDSLIYLINNAIASDTVKRLILGATNLAKLTDEEKAIATNKNWTLS